MRKLLISLAAAGAALVAAGPAAAQYYPAPQPYGYGAPSGGYGYNGYGYGNWGEVRALQARIDRIEQQINWLDRRDRIRDRSADRLRYEAERIEQRLRYAARGGLNPYEARDIQFRVDRLEQQVRYSLAYNRGWDRDDRWGHDRDWDHDRD
jgi:hypothetical protein